MRSLGRAALAAAAFAVLSAGGVHAQQPAAATTVPAVGDMAPDFEIRGATRYGVLRDGVRLSDFRGQTVVLAFFARSRTRG